MKRVLILLLVLLLISAVSAVEIDMKDSYDQGETMIVKFSGNFLKPPFKGTTKLYRGHTRVSFEPYISKISGDYYLYGSLLDKEEDNYSLVMEDVRYYVGTKISNDDLMKNFSVTNKTADFSLKPGYVVTEDDFSLEMQNLKDSEIEIKIETGTLIEEDKGFFSSLFGGTEGEGDEIYSLTLKSGEKEKINFNTEDIKRPYFEKINLVSENTAYEVPVYIFGENVSKKKEDFRLEPSELVINLSTNSDATRILYLYNDGEKLEDISVSISESLKSYVSVSKGKIDELDKDSQEKIELSVTSGDEEKTIEGQLSAKTENRSAYSSISLNFIEDYVPPENYTSYTTKPCSEKGGEICEDDEECDEESVNAKDGVCCLGKCTKKEKSPTGKVIGWVMIIVIAGLLVWFFIKTKKKR